MTVLELVFELNKIAIAISKVEMLIIKEPDNEEHKEKLKVLDEEHNKVIRALVEKLPHLENDENLKMR